MKLLESDDEDEEPQDSVSKDREEIAQEIFEDEDEVVGVNTFSV